MPGLGVRFFSLDGLPIPRFLTTFALIRIISGKYTLILQNKDGAESLIL